MSKNNKEELGDIYNDPATVRNSPIDSMKEEIFNKIELLKDKREEDRTASFTQYGQLLQLKNGYVIYKQRYDECNSNLATLKEKIGALEQAKTDDQTEIAQLKNDLTTANNDKGAVEAFGKEILDKLEQLDKADSKQTQEEADALAEEEEARKNATYFWVNEATADEQVRMKLATYDKLIAKAIAEDNLTKQRTLMEKKAQLRGKTSESNEKFIKDLEQDLVRMNEGEEEKKKERTTYSVEREIDGGSGKGRKTKRRKLMGSKSKKRSKGGKKRVSKK